MSADYIFVYGVPLTNDVRATELMSVDSFEDFSLKFREFLKQWNLEKVEDQLGSATFEKVLHSYYEKWSEALSAEEDDLDLDQPMIHLIATGEWSSNGPYVVMAIPANNLPSYIDNKRKMMH